MEHTERRRLWLRIAGGVVAGVVVTTGVAVLAISRADGPVFIFAGGPFRSGEPVALDAIDWERLDARSELEMEIVSAERSLTLWFSVDQGMPYVGCDLDCVGGRLTRWPQQIEQDDRVVVRIDGKRAEARLRFVPHGSEEYRSATARRLEKYFSDPTGGAAAEAVAHEAVVEIGEQLTGRAERAEPGDRLYRMVAR